MLCERKLDTVCVACRLVDVARAIFPGCDEGINCLFLVLVERNRPCSGNNRLIRFRKVSRAKVRFEIKANVALNGHDVFVSCGYRNPLPVRLDRRGFVLLNLCPVTQLAILIVPPGPKGSVGLDRYRVTVPICIDIHTLSCGHRDPVVVQPDLRGKVLIVRCAVPQLAILIVPPGPKGSVGTNRK